MDPIFIRTCSITQFIAHRQQIFKVIPNLKIEKFASLKTYSQKLDAWRFCHITCGIYFYWCMSQCISQYPEIKITRIAGCCAGSIYCSDHKHKKTTKKILFFSSKYLFFFVRGVIRNNYKPGGKLGFNIFLSTTAYSTKVFFLIKNHRKKIRKRFQKTFKICSFLLFCTIKVLISLWSCYCARCKK